MVCSELQSPIDDGKCESDHMHQPSQILVSHHHFEIQPNKTVSSPKHMRERCTCLKNCGLHECTCVYLFTNASSYDMVSITKIPYQFFKSCCRNARSASHCVPPGILYIHIFFVFSLQHYSTWSVIVTAAYKWRRKNPGCHRPCIENRHAQISQSPLVHRFDILIKQPRRNNGPCCEEQFVIHNARWFSNTI